MLLADVFPTGYHATEQAHVRAGDTVEGATRSISAKAIPSSKYSIFENRVVKSAKCPAGGR